MTAHMQWSDALFGTGVPEIDEQHQALFARVNDLLDACGRGEGGDALRATLDFLGEYIEEHFTAEEALMESRVCSAAAVNKLEHEQFRLRYRELREELLDSEGGANLTQLVLEVRETVCDWLTEHIMTVDTTLAETKP